MFGFVPPWSAQAPTRLSVVQPARHILEKLPIVARVNMF